jgi:hypothetical protein
MRIQRWFWWTLLPWCLTALPLILLIQAFSGPDGYGVKGFFNVIRPDLGSMEGFLMWLWVVLLVFYPLIVLPFAFRRRY